MRRKVRTLMLVALCGGMVFQSGCLGILVPLGLQIGGSLLLSSILGGLLGQPQ